MNTGTLQSFLEEVPVLSKNAQFKIKEIDTEKAIVEVFYPDPVEKDGRLKQITLIKENQIQWKVDKISWERKLNN